MSLLRMYIKVEDKSFFLYNYPRNFLASCHSHPSSVSFPKHFFKVKNS